jgi:hypothetical protein
MIHGWTTDNSEVVPQARSVLIFRAMCSVAGRVRPAIWDSSTSGFHEHPTNEVIPSGYQYRHQEHEARYLIDSQPSEATHSNATDNECRKRRKQQDFV